MSSQARVTRRELLKTTALCVGAAATGPLWSGSSAAAAASLAGQQVNVLHQAGAFWDPWRAQMPNFGMGDVVDEVDLFELCPVRDGGRC
jgi:hypothetical protein